MALLIVTICSALTGQCEVHSLPVNAPLTTCMVGAQAEIAAALPLRGDQKVTSWRCRA